MPGETDGLLLFWGLWVDGFERRSLLRLCFLLHLQDVTHFTLCSFEPGLSHEIALGVTPVLPLRPLLGELGGGVSHFGDHPLCPFWVTPLVTLQFAPHC